VKCSELEERQPMKTLTLTLFLASLGLCLYVYFGYPFILWLASRFRSRPVRRGPTRPPVTLVIAAFNEESVIAAKIENSLALDYPPEKLEVVVVSDGSTDSTEEIVRGFDHPGVRLISRPREGKLRALSAGVERASGEIIVLTDANSVLESDSLTQIVESFADPEVGGVCGNKRYLSADKGDSTGEGEGLYWRYDKWQKKLESSMGSIFAADGAFYAIRKDLFVPIDDPAQADDIAISARVVLQGFRLLYEPAAVAWEEAPREGRKELRRKIRVVNHTIRALLGLRRGLWTSGFYSLELLSHKLVRYFVPFALITLLITNLSLIDQHPVFIASLVAQVLLYLLAVAGLLLRNHRLGQARLLSIPYFFTLVNTAALFGVLSVCKGERRAIWQPRGD
jgi:cellulose synthase/poly-beta-1,6-N-acetylglucosamine synthase-like glycosyltransferase